MESSETPCGSSSTRQTEPHAVAFDTGHPGAGGVYSGKLILQQDGPASETLCVQAVPGLMTAADFCMFVLPCADELLHVRMLRPKSERNSYMVVATFKSCQDASKFSSLYEGKPFLQGLIKETCQVSSVSSGTLDLPSGSSSEGGRTFPTSLLFPAGTTAASAPGPDAGSVQSTSASATDPCDSSLSTCSVCLESLDAQSSALVTTLCNHTMHLACLAKWDLASCPVCRHTHELVPEASTCMSCGQTRGLWMCVICAYVGCGVYNNKHAHAHFEESQHPFAVNMEDCIFWTGDKIKAGSVWDYVSDRFVNRLLSSDDGKVVEVSRDGQIPSGEPVGSSSAAGSAARSAEPGSNARDVAGGNAATSSESEAGPMLSSKSLSASCSRGADSDEEEDDRGFRAAIYASRMDAVVNEYRMEMERMVLDHSSAIARLTEKNAELSRQLSEQEESARTISHLLSDSREEVVKLKKQLSRRSGDAEREGRELRERNSFLKNLNESLLRDKQSWNEEIARLSSRLSAKEKECLETKDELRDMMLHLEAQAKVMDGPTGCRLDAAGPSDVSGGDIVGIGPSPREKLARKARRR